MNSGWKLQGHWKLQGLAESAKALAALADGHAPIKVRASAYFQLHPQKFMEYCNLRVTLIKIQSVLVRERALQSMAGLPLITVPGGCASAAHGTEDFARIRARSHGFYRGERGGAGGRGRLRR